LTTTAQAEIYRQPLIAECVSLNLSLGLFLSLPIPERLNPESIFAVAVMRTRDEVPWDKVPWDEVPFSTCCFEIQREPLKETLKNFAFMATKGKK
jgi:hypothetical protein